MLLIPYKNKHDCKIPINGGNHFGRIIPLRFYYAEWILFTVKEEQQLEITVTVS